MADPPASKPRRARAKPITKWEVVDGDPMTPEELTEWCRAYLRLVMEIRGRQTKPELAEK